MLSPSKREGWALRYILDKFRTTALLICAISFKEKVNHPNYLFAN